MATNNNLVDTIQGANTALDEMSAKVQQLGVDFGQMGAAGSAALGSLSAMLRNTSPILSQAVGSLQKMVPILASIGAQAKISGVALKTAFASSAPGLIVVALTEMLSLLGSIKDKANEVHDAMASMADDIASALGVVDDLSLLRAQDKANLIQQKTGGGNLFTFVKSNALQAASSTDKSKLLDIYNNVLKGINGKLSNGDITQEEAELFKSAFIAIYNQNKKSTTTTTTTTTKKTEEPLKGGNDIVEAAATLGADMGASLTAPQGVAETMDAQARANRILYLNNQLSDLEKSYAQGKIDKTSYESQRTDIVNELAQLNAPNADKLAGTNIQTQSASSDAGDWDKAMESLSAYSDMLSTVSTMINQVSQARVDSIKSQVESGKMSTSEGKKQLKQQAILQASMSMAAGISASVFSMLEAWKSAPGGWIGKAAAAVSSTAAVLATTISSVNSIKSAGEGLSGTTVTPTTTASPSIQQVYVSNNDYSAELSSIKDAISTQQTVLVVEDYQKVADNANKVKVQSSF